MKNSEQWRVYEWRSSELIPTHFVLDDHHDAYLLGMRMFGEDEFEILRDYATINRERILYN